MNGRASFARRGALVLALVPGMLLAIPRSTTATPAVESGALAHGGTYMIAVDAAAPVAAIDLWFRAPDDGYSGETPGLARIAATAAAAAKLASGKTLAETVTQAGGQLSIQVFPDLVTVGAIVPTLAARRVLASLTAAYFAPAIDAAALHAATSDATVIAVQQHYEGDVLVQDLLFSRLFASKPANEPPVPLAIDALSHVTLQEASAFAQRAFRASNAFLTVAGAVDPTILAAVTDGNGPAPAQAPIDAIPVSPLPAPTTQEGSGPAIGIAWIGPPISDERAATALDFVADYLFRERVGTVSAALDRSGTRIDLNGQFVTLHSPGVMLVTLEGTDDASAQTQVLRAVSALQQPMDPAAFAAAREAFLYHLDVDTQTPGEQADMLGWYAAEGAASYAPGGDEYERITRSLDPGYVAATVRRYLSNPTVVRIVVGSSSGGAS
ncbi:MAG TPA: insulinase family protein [Candidatus Tyrphobacter sp.]